MRPVFARKESIAHLAGRWNGKRSPGRRLSPNYDAQLHEGAHFGAAGLAPGSVCGHARRVIHATRGLKMILVLCAADALLYMSQKAVAVGQPGCLDFHIPACMRTP